MKFIPIVLQVIVQSFRAFAFLEFEYLNNTAKHISSSIQILAGIIENFHFL